MFEEFKLWAKRFLVELKIGQYFTGSVTIHFHRGQPSKKVEIKDYRQIGD